MKNFYIEFFIYCLKKTLYQVRTFTNYILRKIGENHKILGH